MSLEVVEGGCYEGSSSKGKGRIEGKKGPDRNKKKVPKVDPAGTTSSTGTFSLEERLEVINGGRKNWTFNLGHDLLVFFQKRGRAEEREDH